jgi:hypothetical protein
MPKRGILASGKVKRQHAKTETKLTKLSELKRRWKRVN